MVGDLRVVDEAPAERALAGPGGEERRVGPGDRRDDRGQRRGDVAREVAAVGARVAEELLLLVERLRDVQRLLRREAEEPVGVALQLGEVVEERRREPARLRLDRLDLARVPLRTRSTIASASAPSFGSRRASGVGRSPRNHVPR